MLRGVAVRRRPVFSPRLFAANWTPEEGVYAKAKTVPTIPPPQTLGNNYGSGSSPLPRSIASAFPEESCPGLGVCDGRAAGGQ